jgi:hypothetical protein
MSISKAAGLVSTLYGVSWMVPLGQFSMSANPRTFRSERVITTEKIAGKRIARVLSIIPPLTRLARHLTNRKNDNNF